MVRTPDAREGFHDVLDAETADDADTTDRQASSGTLMVASLLPQCDEVPTACTARAQDAVAEQATHPARSVPCDSMR